MIDRPEFSRRTRAFELVAVAALVFVIVMGTAHIDPAGAERGADVLAFVCGIGAALSLLLWRRQPLAMVAIVATAIFVYFARAYPPGPALLPGPISLVLLGLRAKRTVAWAGALLMWAAVTLGLAIGDGRGDRLALAAVGWTLSAVLAGQLVAARRDRVVGERERRRLADRQAVTDERLRIAQDLHDSVAHAMATINVQAGTAAHLLANRPDRVDPVQLQASLEAIRSASGEVLDELGVILGLLRRDADNGEGPPLQPQVGLDRIDELVARVRADGFDVTYTAGDRLTTLPVPISAAAYRVVQEALSNVRRHAGADARIRIDAERAADGALRVEVVDDGGGGVPASVPASVAPVTEGFGLVGMRERVESTGGRLVTGPQPGGGFRVLATWAGR